MPADHFVAMCGYTALPSSTAAPTGLPHCPKGSDPVINPAASLEEFWITEDGQFRPYSIPPMPFAMPTCLGASGRF